jgi:hypothetical protein
MIKHIIAQIVWVAVVYAFVAFAYGGWWSPFDWEGRDGQWARGTLAFCWVWLGLLVAAFTEDLGKA